MVSATFAEAAVSRQLDFEAQAERLESVQTEAADEAGGLKDCFVALTTRKTEVEQALAAFETAHRGAALGGEGPTRPTRTTESKVRPAEEAFDRATTAAGGVAGVTRMDAQTAAKVAEIATLQKNAAIAQRMAALRSAR
jgi:phage shock protein A